ncbi:MAG TPA: hypothetical protein VHB21_22475 [Minicystis sp.]|nr:hypothetical protein [Minicystis sp.]
MLGAPARRTFACMRRRRPSNLAALSTTLALALGAAGCTITPRPRFVDAARDADARARPLDLEALDAASREAFAREHVELTHVAHGHAFCADPKKPSYFIGDAEGPITENEFARRYRAVTGSRVLDAVRHPRRPLGPIVALFALDAAAVVALSVWIGHGGLANSGPEGEGAAGLGMILASPLLTGGLLVEAVAHEDGQPEEHELTEDDARVYVQRFDLALYARERAATERRRALSQNTSRSPLTVGSRRTAAFGAGFGGTSVEP